MIGNTSKNEILDAVAPCAFCCFTCAAMKGGVLEETSVKLRHYMEGYYEFNRKNLPFKYRAYSKKIKLLTEGLDLLSNRPCRGCRAGADPRCCIPNCFISECAERHEVDFCGECRDFPCEKALDFFKGDTLAQWKFNNEMIKKGGVESYYEYACSHSHYDFYRR